MAKGPMQIIVGVTGHRELRMADLEALEARTGAILSQIGDEYPHTPLMVMTPLAEGADRILAHAAISRGIPYLVPLPMPVELYEKDFQAESLDDFRRLLAGAHHSYVLPFLNGTTAENVCEPDRRARQYASVGAHVAAVSHLFIALWDGVASEAVGGTAQIIQFRAFGAPPEYLSEYSPLDAPDTGIIYHLYAPREGGFLDREPGELQRLRAGAPDLVNPLPLVALKSDERDPFDLVYRHIEEFNRDAVLVEPESRPFPKTGEKRSATQELRDKAERAANHYQRFTRRALRHLLLSTAVAALALSLYSHVARHTDWLVLPYALFVVLAVTIFMRAKRGAWQDKSQDYRALEMGLTVQRAWDQVDVGKSVAASYLRQQRTELDWIPAAIRTAHVLDFGLPFRKAAGAVAVRNFVSEQLRFFLKAGRRETLLNQRVERFSRIALITSFVFGFLVLVFGVSLIVRRSASLFGIPSLHGWLTFGVAATTILAALSHEYHHLRAFRQHARSYQVMHNIYQRAMRALDEAERTGDGELELQVARAVICEVGREALAENADWVLLHRELPIEYLPV
jgi:hypothetical protein